MPSGAITGQAAIAHGPPGPGAKARSGPTAFGSRPVARPTGRTSLTSIGTRAPNSRSTASVASARYGSSGPVPVRCRLTGTPASSTCASTRNTAARGTSRSCGASRLAEKWSRAVIARRIVAGTGPPSRAKNSPLSSATRDPAACAARVNSCARPGSRSGSPPVSSTASGRCAGVNERTKRSSWVRRVPSGWSGESIEEAVEQCAHASGQRRVRATSSPAAGSGRRSTISDSSTSVPPGPSTRRLRLWRRPLATRYTAA